MISLSKPAILQDDEVFVTEALQQMQQGKFNQAIAACEDHLQQQYGTRAFLTPSCTAALEMAALSLELQPGDEVIVPSYTYVGTVTPFERQGVVLRFADSSATHPNVDAASIGRLINKKTKALVVVHYGGVACDMDAILSLAEEAGIPVIEDAAHCIAATYKNRYLGTMGALGTLSFDSQKNISCLQGGALFVNDMAYLPAAEIVRHNGTNKAAFLRKEVSTFEWTGNGGNYEISNISAAVLLGPLKRTAAINQQRMQLWQQYYEALAPLQEKGFVQLPAVPAYAQHNAHIFYLLPATADERNRFIAFMQTRGVQALFHYLALHRSPYRRAQQLTEDLPNADLFEQRLVRLPLHTQLSSEEQQQVIKAVYSFFEQPY